MVGQGPPYDCTEVGQPAGLTEIACSCFSLGATKSAGATSAMSQVATHGKARSKRFAQPPQPLPRGERGQRIG